MIVISKLTPTGPYITFLDQLSLYMAWLTGDGVGTEGSQARYSLDTINYT